MNIYKLRHLEKMNLLTSDEYTVTDYRIGNTATASIVFAKLSDFNFLQSKGIDLRFLLDIQKSLFKIKEKICGQKLSEDVTVIASFEESTLKGRYDFKNDYLVHLADSNLNSVTGIRSVEEFPWGDSRVSKNVVKNSVLNHNSGKFFNNTVTDSYVFMDYDKSSCFDCNIGDNSALEFSKPPSTPK